jgi:hypothetical protein
VSQLNFSEAASDASQHPVCDKNEPRGQTYPDESARNSRPDRVFAQLERSRPRAGPSRRPTTKNKLIGAELVPNGKKRVRNPIFQPVQELLAQLDEQSPGPGPAPAPPSSSMRLVNAGLALALAAAPAWLA